MQFLRFDSLSCIPNLRHAVTTRGGANGPYDALNLAYHVGDDAARVTENRRAVAEILGYDAARLVAAQQVHGSKVEFIFQEGRGAFDWDSAVPDCDALIVQAPRVPILIQVADCAPILLVDPKNHVLAVVHAGWRGAVANIASQTLAKMQSAFGTSAGDVLVGIGPTLCVFCFEIGEEVAQAARATAPDAVLLGDESRQKPNLDLRLLLRRDLEDWGVLPQNIEVMPHCPRCANGLLFSHRGQNGTAGRFGLVAWWEA